MALLFVKSGAAAAALGLSKTGFYEAVKDGRMTTPVKTRLSGRSVAWPEEEVAAVRRAVIAGHSAKQVKELVEKLHDQRCAAGGAHGG